MPWRRLGWNKALPWLRRGSAGWPSSSPELEARGVRLSHETHANALSNARLPFTWGRQDSTTPSHVICSDVPVDRRWLLGIIWEVLKGGGVDGAGGNLPFFCAFLAFFFAFLAGISPFFALFFAFLRFILEQGANNCNLLERWGISLRPRLHRPRWELPELFKKYEGRSQARRRQLRASSGGSSDATSKASFPLHNTEARQHQGNLDVTSDVILSYCCCCPFAGADL